MRLRLRTCFSLVAVALLRASYQAAMPTRAVAAETATFAEVSSSLSDFANQAVVEKLIENGAVVSLGVIYNRKSPPPHFRFVVAIPPGRDSTGRNFSELAESQLPKNFEGFEVFLAGGNKREKPTANQDISLALKALNDFLATPGLRRLFANEGSVGVSVDVNFIAPPPELDVGMDFGFQGGGISDRTLERDIPAVFEGFPVRVNWGGRYAYGTLKSRPGRVPKAK